MSDKFAPTIIPAEPGYFIVSLYRNEDREIHPELTPIIAWAILTSSDTLSNGIDVLPVPTGGVCRLPNGRGDVFGCTSIPVWLIKSPDGRFSDQGDDFTSHDEELAIKWLKASFAEYEEEIEKRFAERLRAAVQS